MKNFLIHLVAGAVIFAAGFFRGDKSLLEREVIASSSSERGRLMDQAEREPTSAGTSSGCYRLSVKKAVEYAQPWLETLRSADQSKHPSVFVDLEAALLGSAPVEVYAALMTLREVGARNFDCAPFRSLVANHLDAESPDIQLAAWFALPDTGIQEGDLERLYTLKEDSFFRPKMTRLLKRFNQGDFTGESGKIVNDLLRQTTHPHQLSDLISPLRWRAKFSPDLKKTILEITKSDNHQLAQNALFVIRPFAPESPKIMRRMLELVSHPYSNIASNAFGVMERGIPESMQSEVGGTALRFIASRNDGTARISAFRMLRHSQPEHLPLLEDALKNPTLLDEERDHLLTCKKRLSQEAE